MSDPGERRARARPPTAASPRLDDRVRRCLTSAGHPWVLEGVHSREGAVELCFSWGLTLTVTPSSEGGPYYRRVHETAFSYRAPSNRPLDRAELAEVDGAIGALCGVLPDLLEGARTPAPEPEPEPPPGAVAPAADGFPTDADWAHLDSDAPLLPEAISGFRRDGFVLLRGLLDPSVMLAAAPLIQVALARHWPDDRADDPLEGYEKAFVQITNVGLRESVVRALTHARRISHAAAQLMGVRGVRIYCENWLLKRPGEGPTGWHQDSVVFPFEAEASVTAWIPIQPVTAGMGLVRFARGSHLVPLDNRANITAEADRALDRAISTLGLEVVTSPPLFLGDVSFHDGRTLHGAEGNSSSTRRDALALHLFADGARMRAPTTVSMSHQVRAFAPDLLPGDLADTPCWPRVYASAPGVPAEEPWRKLSAVALPLGEPRTLWIHDGLLHAEGPADAPLLHPGGGFALSGLVDSHSHVSWPHQRGTASHTFAFMNAIRTRYATLGTTLLRDMGSDRDEVCRLRDEPGLPRIVTAGMLLLRDDRWPLTETPPERLREAMLERLARGASWVKVLADSTDDFQGRENPGFSSRDAVTYPLDVLGSAVAAVHDAGGRVAAHCFTAEGASVAVGAGVDSLEHGWGLDEDLLEAMKARAIAWTPLVGIARPMLEIAERFGEVEKVAWIRRSLDALRRLLPLASAEGITILAGTDWFPRPTVADEIGQLHGLGLPASRALAAGTYEARRFLGLPGLQAGAPADVVVYDEDPRERLEALDRPRLVVIAGKVVEGVG